MKMITKRRGSIHDATIAGLYDLEQTIGRGHFAVVKLARHVFTGEKVAVKVIDKHKLDPVSREHLFQEVRCMKLVQHPNVVRLYEVIDTQSKLFLILELGDYDMFEYIMRFSDRGVVEAEAQRYFCQIVQAISYCHQLHVVHRDLKPENVVFFEKLGMVKLTDFGFSNLFCPGQKLETSCGSLAYSAPEILLGDSYEAPAVDVWSLGVILFMLVCGRLPFSEANDSETLTKILDCKFTLPSTLSVSCTDLIRRLLVRDPARRAKLAEVERNPWVASGDLGHAALIPLVSRAHVSEEGHEQILEQMMNGGIANPEDVVRALEKDEYTYVTATYWLLAERLLRRERQEQAQRLVTAAAAKSDSQLALASLALSPRSQAKHRHDSTGSATTEDLENVDPASAHPGHAPPLARQRTCSIVEEESEEDSIGVLDAPRCVHRSRSRGSSPRISPSQSCSSIHQTLVRLGSIGRRSGHATPSPTPSDAQLELQEITARVSWPNAAAMFDRSNNGGGGSRSPSPLDLATSSGSGVGRHKGSLVPLVVARKLPSVSSSPHLLEICEEAEEECGDAFNTFQAIERKGSTGCAGGGSRHGEQTYSAFRMIRPRQAVVSPDVIRRYDRATGCKSRRSTSCSSSEASDDDTDKRFGLFTINRCRRDSDDDDGHEPPSVGGPSNPSADSGCMFSVPGGSGGNSNNNSGAGKPISNGGGSGQNVKCGASALCNGSLHDDSSASVLLQTVKHRFVDPRKLAGRLQKLALAPIREIPHLLLPAWFRSSYPVVAVATDEKLALAESGKRGHVTLFGEADWLKCLQKPKSCENLTHTRVAGSEAAASKTLPKAKKSSAAKNVSNGSLHLLDKTLTNSAGAGDEAAACFTAAIIASESSEDASSEEEEECERPVSHTDACSSRLAMPGKKKKRKRPAAFFHQHAPSPAAHAMAPLSTELPLGSYCKLRNQTNVLSISNVPCLTNA